jgi:hypothetical protein
VSTDKKSLKSKIEVEIVAEVAAPKPRLSSTIEKTSSRVKNYLLDLRIQSPESLGLMGLGGLDAAPALIRLSRAKGIDVIGVADYFSGAFIDRAVTASANSGVTVIPGVVIRCTLPACRDVSLLCLFDTNTTSALVGDFLRAIGVSEKDFGNKSLVLETPLEKVVAELDLRGALCIPTRMDKTPSRMLAIPELVEKYGFRAFDVCYPETTRMFKARWPKTKFQFLSFSNASALAQVGSRVAKMKLNAPLFASIKSSILREVL